MPISWVFLVLSTFCLNQVAVADTATNNLKNQTAAITKAATMSQVDLNHATLKELSKIKGLGKKRAKSILQYRQQRGNFQSLNDLVHVKGFTEKNLETFLNKNQGKITVLH